MVPGEFWDLVPVDASRGDVRAAIGKDGSRLVFGHKKPPAGDRGGRALVRPGLLPIGRIPFREPPCAGTQVGEGIALLLMQFTDYRCFFWPSNTSTRSWIGTASRGTTSAGLGSSKFPSPACLARPSSMPPMKPRCRVLRESRSVPAAPNQGPLPPQSLAISRRWPLLVSPKPAGYHGYESASASVWSTAAKASPRCSACTSSECSPSRRQRRELR